MIQVLEASPSIDETIVAVLDGLAGCGVMSMAPMFGGPAPMVAWRPSPLREMDRFSRCSALCGR
ncbi:MAG: hypothetical protein AAFV86_20465 [Pseudomonadota bacterium]